MRIFIPYVAIEIGIINIENKFGGSGIEVKIRDYEIKSPDIGAYVAKPQRN